jgi:aflatoxin B1 aldehyde reductase
MSQPTSLLYPCDAVAHVYGVAMFGPERKFHTLDAAQEVLDTLASANVTRLSTAQLYGQSESTLGQLDAGRLFHIDTKAAGGVGSGALERDELVKRAKESLVRLKVKQVSQEP